MLKALRQAPSGLVRQRAGGLRLASPKVLAAQALGIFHLLEQCPRRGQQIRVPVALQPCDEPLLFGDSPLTFADVALGLFESTFRFVHGPS